MGKIYKQNPARPRTSTLNSARATAQRRQRLSTRARGATEYYNYAANEADEERGHGLPTFQQNAVNRIRNETDEDREASLKSKLSSSMHR